MLVQSCRVFFVFCFNTWSQPVNPDLHHTATVIGQRWAHSSSTKPSADSEMAEGTKTGGDVCCLNVCIVFCVADSFVVIPETVHFSHASVHEDKLSWLLWSLDLSCSTVIRSKNCGLSKSLVYDQLNSHQSKLSFLFIANYQMPTRVSSRQFQPEASGSLIFITTSPTLTSKSKMAALQTTESWSPAPSGRPHRTLLLEKFMQ